eukprot:3944976-Prymnesium_polylepis.1
MGAANDCGTRWVPSASSIRSMSSSSAPCASADGGGESRASADGSGSSARTALRTASRSY